MADHHVEISTDHGTGKKTLSGYVLGLLLSLVLTFMAFAIVGKRLLTEKYAYIALAVLAVVQLIVQSICFLRLNTTRDGQWNLLPFLFAILIIAILVGGSLWIMYNLNYYMT